MEEEVAYEVKAITEDVVILKLFMDDIAIQQLKYKSITKNDRVKCGSFPAYI